VAAGLLLNDCRLLAAGYRDDVHLEGFSTAGTLLGDAEKQEAQQIHIH
jgi:hypothetical protein